jgi:hypothetical protein
MGKILSRELERRGIGLEKYASEVLGGVIPIEALEAIYQGRIPKEKFNISQLTRLQENLTSVDGDTVGLDELAYLAPPIKH